MTAHPHAHNVVGMTNHCSPNPALIAVALSAVISMTIGQLVDLAVQTLGSGPTSTLAVVGNLAGAVACIASVALGLRFYRRGRAELKLSRRLS
jgi:hypothetical protein